MKRPVKCVPAALLVLFGFALLAASVHAQSTFVYTNNNETPNTVTAFSVGPGGTLTMVGSPFPTGGNGSGLFSASNTATVTIRKKILYVANTGSNTISGFSINTTTGALTPVPDSPFATKGDGSFFGISLAVTPNGKFVYAGNAGSRDISAFSVGSNGALTAITGSPFFIGDSPFSNSGAIDPNGMATNAEGTLLYVANGDNTVTGFSINNSNGSLSPVSGNRFDTGGTGFLRSLTTFPAKRVEGEGDENGDDGHKGHFRFEAEHECKASSGMEFEESDGGKGMRGSVDTYTVVGNTATITGAGTLLDGTPVHYTAIVLGNAPVIGANRFAISWVTSTLSVFHTSGALTDGYIAVHAQ